jgi:hypothetical protein
MNGRRAYLKELAARSARRWSTAPLPASLSGETRVETRNTIYQLRDGVCYAVTRHAGAESRGMHPSSFVGMRIVGWLTHDSPQTGIRPDWSPGAYAVLWRPRLPSEEHSAVALTSSSHAFRAVTPSVPDVSRRPSSPPPLPPAVPRSTLLPRPVTPPAWIHDPPPLSTTRVHMGQIPAAPETPTVRRPSSIPPPLPLRAQPVRRLQTRLG